MYEPCEIALISVSMKESRRLPDTLVGTIILGKLQLFYICLCATSTSATVSSIYRGPGWIPFGVMQVAAGMMRACLSTGGNTCRLMLFAGGPCTEGPGKVVSRELTEHMRSHKVIKP